MPNSSTFTNGLPETVFIRGGAGSASLVGQGCNGRSSPQHQTEPVRILLLEDNACDAELIQAALSPVPCQVLHVAKRNDFVAALEGREFDVILSDYSLPSFDGMSALTIVREKGLKLPFIFISGTIGDELAVECVKAGATDYVLKDKLTRLAPVLLRALQEARLRTEHQLIEGQLRMSEAKNRAILDNAADGILTVDERGIVDSVNPAAAKIFGYPDRELVGQNIRLLIPPACHHQDQGAPYHRTESDYFGNIGQHRELVGRRKDGQSFPLDLAVSEVRLNNRRMFVAMVRDITERKEAEEELTCGRERLRLLAARLQSIREEEQTRIAREVHDVLGQALTGLKIDLRWLRARLPTNGNVLRARTGSMLDLIDGTIQTVRKIARELRPAVLDNLGLAVAIDWQANDFQSRTGIDCRCAIDLDDDHLSIECSTAVFRIFQEALTNVARHAQATVVAVTLHEFTGDVVLEVRDNGRGITEGQMHESRSLGLLGMRERALALAGDVQISGAHGQGTTVVVRIPKEPNQNTSHDKSSHS